MFGGPVARLQKDRDRTGPGPIKTGNFQDRSRPQPRSGLQSIAISKYSRPIKTGFNQSQPVFTALEAGYSNMRYLYNISTSKVMEVLDELSTARRVASENPRKQINDDKHC